MIITKDSTDITTYFKLVDPATFVPETGLTITDLDATYVRDGATAVKADLTALEAADSSHADNKAYEVNGTYMPGLYRVDWPDAAFATGVNNVQLCISGAAISPAYLSVELASCDLGDANLTLINGDSVVGNEATLTLKQLDIQNDSGAALLAKSTFGNGIQAEGSITGISAGGLIGISAAATSDGTGFSASSESGTGFSAYSTSGNGFVAAEITAIPALTKTAIEAAGSHLALIKTKTDTIPASPAEVGSAMTLTAAYDLAKTAASSAEVAALNNLSITDVRTAVGLASANLDTQLSAIDTVVDAVKVKTDQLEFTASTVNANIATGGVGSGAETINYYVYTNESAKTGAIANVSVWVTSDEAGLVTVAQGETDADGKVTFYLDTGTYYFWRSKTGYTFTNPDLEVIS
jgi:hypothetical protein